MRRTDYQWEGAGMYRMSCWECGQQFSARRTDACYCGASCRKKANRRKAHIQESAQLACENIKFLLETREKRPDLADDVRKALASIRWVLPVTTGTSQLVVQQET